MSSAILEQIAENAKAVDKNEIPARYGLELLGEQKLFTLDTARQLRQIAAEDLSVAFSIWAHTMVTTYLRTADTAYTHELLPAREAGQRPGVTLGSPFALLGLNATASAWISLEDVFVPEAQILSRSFEEFIGTVRPTCMILQTSECLGVADAAISVAVTRLAGINEVLTAFIPVQSPSETQLKRELGRARAQEGN